MTFVPGAAGYPSYPALHPFPPTVQYAHLTRRLFAMTSLFAVLLSEKAGPIAHPGRPSHAAEIVTAHVSMEVPPRGHQHTVCTDCR